MGLIHAQIELINGGDLVLAHRHLMGEEEVRHTRVNMLVDTGSTYMCINEYIQKLLQLTVREKKRVEMADGQIVECELVGPVEVRFKDRRCNVDAIVLPGDTGPLLGAIPMEDMDIMIHPRRQELDGHPDHPEGGLWMLKGMRPLVVAGRPRSALPAAGRGLLENSPGQVPDLFATAHKEHPGKKFELYGSDKHRG